MGEGNFIKWICFCYSKIFALQQFFEPNELLTIVGYVCGECCAPSAH